MSRNYEQHPELFPWVEEMARRIQIEHNNDFDAFVREQEALAAACTCEYDGGYGDDGSIVKRFPKRGCPVHQEEDNDEFPEPGSRERTEPDLSQGESMPHHEHDGNENTSIRRQEGK